MNMDYIHSLLKIYTLLCYQIAICFLSLLTVFGIENTYENMCILEHCKEMETDVTIIK